MKTSLFFAVVLLVLVSNLLSSINETQKENVATVNREQLSAQFLHYVESLNNLFASGTPGDGDVTQSLVLPAWLPKSSTIKLQVYGGQAYLFMPLSPGVLEQLLLDTENSAHIGISDATGINTPAGKLNRPGFIPAGYVVYVR